MIQSNRKDEVGPRRSAIRRYIQMIVAYLEDESETKEQKEQHSYVVFGHTQVCQATKGSAGEALSSS